MNDDTDPKLVVTPPLAYQTPALGSPREARWTTVTSLMGLLAIFHFGLSCCAAFTGYADQTYSEVTRWIAYLFLFPLDLCWLLERPFGVRIDPFNGGIVSIAANSTLFAALVIGTGLFVFRIRIVRRH